MGIMEEPTKTRGRPRSQDPGRPRSFWMRDSTVEQLDARAEVEGVTRSDLVHRAVDELLQSPP